MEKNYKVNDDLTLEMDGRTYRLTKNKLNSCGHCPLHKIQGCGELCGTTYYKAAETPSFDYSDAIFIEVDESKETAMKKDEIDYKTLYEETISKLKSAKENVGYYTFSEVIDKVIPEVAESEDEKIRKALIKYLEALDDEEIRYGVSFKEMRSWLEKHKEQKTTWDEDDEKMLTLCASSVRTRYNDGLLTDEEYEQASSWLKSLKERVQSQPKWSEKDEEMRIDAIKYLEIFDAQGIHGDVAWPCIDWLKSLKDRVIPQTKQEWSEGDEIMLDRLIKHFNKNEFDRGYEVGISAAKFNQWKPTEEQMEALGDAIKFYKTTHFDSYHVWGYKLETLYNDLKKL